MKRKGYYKVMRENADAEFRRVQQEKADYITSGRIPALEGRASKSGRTKIYAATPSQITFQYCRKDNGFNYRDVYLKDVIANTPEGIARGFTLAGWFNKAAQAVQS